MSLILVFHNDQKEPGQLKEDASYNVQVLVGDGGPFSKTIASGRVEHHMRSDGWEILVRRFLDELAMQSSCQHTFDQDGDYGVETCTRCGTTRG